MGLFDQLKGMITGKTRSEIDFEKKLKEIEKQGGTDKEQKKLEMAYAHNSALSAFWWYEHMPVKPNSGSDRDVEMLHAKYKCSLERNTEVSYDKHKEMQTNFLKLVLPDINYTARGFKSKDDCIKKMLAFCPSLHRKNKSNIAIICSPFYSPEYWLLFNTDDNSIADGKLIIQSDGTITFNDGLKNGYAFWFEMLIKFVSIKYNCYGVSEMKMPK